MTCGICADRGYTTRDHAYWQDGATQYETVEEECECVAAAPTDADAGPECEVRGVDLVGTAAEVEAYAHELGLREREGRTLRMRAKVAAMRGVWR